MATISWRNQNGRDTLKHIEGGIHTLCGLVIPARGKEWNVFGTPECKRCIKIENKAED